MPYNRGKKNVLAGKAIKQKKVLDAENGIRIAEWREMVLNSDFMSVLMTKVMTGRDAWYDEAEGKIVLGDALEQESKQFYDKLIISKLLPTPKEVVETKSEGMADGLRQILAAVEKDENRSKLIDSPAPVVDVDIVVKGDVDF